MHQNSVTLDSAGAITRYFAKANLHTQTGNVSGKL